MIIESKKIDGVIEPKYEVYLECSNCGMQVDDIEYNSGTCSDCGQPWDEKRHVAIHVTTVPITGHTM